MREREKKSRPEIETCKQNENVSKPNNDINKITGFVFSFKSQSVWRRGSGQFSSKRRGIDVVARRHQSPESKISHFHGTKTHEYIGRVLRYFDYDERNRFTTN